MNFLVDAQLPPLLCNWINSTTRDKARHVNTLSKGLTSTDSEIWKIAVNSHETIITKDFDFFDRALVSDLAPRILHINIGNCANKQLIDYIGQNWDKINDIFDSHYNLISCSYESIEYW